MSARFEERALSRDEASRFLRECLDGFPHVRLQVTGECMRPALRPGDVVQLVSASRRRPRFGDVVLVRLPAGLRLHRLVWGRRHGGTWRRTKSDRGRAWDPAVAHADLLGVVVAVERAGGAGPMPRARWRGLLSLARVRGER